VGADATTHQTYKRAVRAHAVARTMVALLRRSHTTLHTFKGEGIVAVAAQDLQVSLALADPYVVTLVGLYIGYSTGGTDCAHTSTIVWHLQFGSVPLALDGTTAATALSRPPTALR
jgi:hypothetical protein